MTKPRIFCVDIDGPTALYPGPMLEFFAEKTGQTYTSVAASKREFGPGEWRRLKNMYRASGIKADLPLTPGAIPFLNSLQDQGYFVVMLTTRPQWDPKVVEDTTTFVTEKIWPYVKDPDRLLLHMVEDKREVFDLYNPNEWEIVGLIDDDLDTLLLMREEAPDLRLYHYDPDSNGRIVHQSILPVNNLQQLIGDLPHERGLLDVPGAHSDLQGPNDSPERPQTLFILEGPDKSGKSAVYARLRKFTQWGPLCIDRFTLSNRVYDAYYGRQPDAYDLRDSEGSIRSERALGRTFKCVLVLLTAQADVLRARVHHAGDTAAASDIPKAIELFDKEYERCTWRKIRIDTSIVDIDQTIDLIIKFAYEEQFSDNESDF